MSKKAKSASKERNKKIKQGRKQANRLMYQTWAKNGENSKGTRSNRTSKRKKKINTKHLHIIAHCGNIGCRKCFAVSETKVFAITRN